MQIHLVFVGPIVAGDAAIDETLAKIAADFLRADQKKIQLRVIRTRAKAAGRNVNLVASLGEKLDGGLLKTAFRNRDFECA